MPPKKNVEAPDKGKNTSAHLAAAAAANNSNTTSTTSTTTANSSNTTSITAAATTTAATTAPAAAIVVAGCEPRDISNRMLERDAKGIPWFIGTMRENINQALCRKSKEVKSSPEWQAANPADKKAMVQAARSHKEQEQYVFDQKFYQTLRNES